MYTGDSKMNIKDITEKLVSVERTQFYFYLNFLRLNKTWSQNLEFCSRDGLLLDKLDCNWITLQVVNCLFSNSLRPLKQQNIWFNFYQKSNLFNRPSQQKLLTGNANIIHCLKGIVSTVEMKIFKTRIQSTLKSLLSGTRKWFYNRHKNFGQYIHKCFLHY